MTKRFKIGDIVNIIKTDIIITLYKKNNGDKIKFSSNEIICTEYIKKGNFRFIILNELYSTDKENYVSKVMEYNEYIKNEDDGEFFWIENKHIKKDNRYYRKIKIEKLLNGIYY